MFVMFLLCVEYSSLSPLVFVCCFFPGRISGLEEEARLQKQVLSKAEAEKRQLQEKLTDQEKVNQERLEPNDSKITSSRF